MAVIYAPNKLYTGISAGVPFLNGKGETDDMKLLEWFSKHGYHVESLQTGNISQNTTKEDTGKAVKKK